MTDPLSVRERDGVRAMTQLIPNRFLFRFEFPIHPWTAPIRIDAKLSKWDERYRLPELHRLDGERGFGEVFAAWHADGLLVAARVAGKRQPPRCDPVQFRHSDHLRVMTDMRDTRDIRRATRFCQHFYFLPAGGGANGREPAAGAAYVARAREDAPLPKPGAIPVASEFTSRGYSIEALIPANVLVGYDPVEHPRIGFFYTLEDRELGKQPLTVGDDLNWWCDPSTWATGVLTK
jgi:hypothetical protein